MASGFFGNAKSGFSSATGPIGAGSFDDNLPEWQGVALDPGTIAILQQQYDQAQKSNQEVAAQAMAGISGTIDPNSFASGQRFSSNLGGASDPAVAAALQDRAQRAYGADVSRLKGQALANAPTQRAGLEATANQSLLQTQQRNNEINQRQWESDMTKMMLRNQVVSNLFNAGGMMAGMYMGGKLGRGGNNAPTQYTKRYSGDESSPNFMGPPRPPSSVSSGQWAGPDSAGDTGIDSLGDGRPAGGYGSGVSYQGLG